ncbi:MAG: ATP-binding protein [Verrucomicrobiota bacterium]|nr:ATP-binding protein [Verrucomicrobiota bacterium]
MPQQTIIRIEKEDAAAPLSFSLSEHECFRNNHLFVGIDCEIFRQVVRHVEIIHCVAGEIIFEEDETGDSLYLIAQGSVKISKKGRAGQQETLAFLMEEDFFGEMALLDRSKRSAQAAAAGHVVLGRMARPGWDLLLRLAPEGMLNNFTKAVTKRLRHNNQHFIEEIMRNERLALIGTTMNSIVHDMTNPIASILGACEVIRGQNEDSTTQNMARLIREAVGKMEIMTRELMDFSRGKTRLALETVQIGELVHDLQADFARCRPAINVHIEVLYDDCISVDRNRLLRVLCNLIRNAREAMIDSPKKVLRFAVKRIEKQLRFEISDTGCGVPAELLPRLFEPFMTHGKANGNGLGLAISKSVVEAHHGTIAVESSERGTVFRIDLPLDLK